MSTPAGFSKDGFERLRRWQKSMTDSGVLPFTQLYISKGGKEVYYNHTGFQDIDFETPISRNSVSRIYSMTKPISSLALMQLFEEGKLQLGDPVHLYLGSKWKKQNMLVLDPEITTLENPEYTKCQTSITVKMLLNHTSGISYGFDMLGSTNPVDKQYFEKGLLVQRPDSAEGNSSFSDHHQNLKEFVDKLSEMPLLFQPGTAFTYGYNVEVTGRLVEIISGMDFASYVRQKILKPLKMNHTDFYPSAEDIKDGLFTSLYRHPLNASVRGLKLTDVKLKKIAPTGRQWTTTQSFFKPGEGLVSTVDDYARFCHMLRNGGELDGARIIGRKTIEFMAMNHLKRSNQNEIKEVSTKMYQHPSAFGEIAVEGVGFGLGFATVVSPTDSEMNISPGSFFWSGAASTFFWVDPLEDICVVFFTQVMHVDVNLLPLKKILCNQIYSTLSYESSSLSTAQVSAARILGKL